MMPKWHFKQLQDLSSVKWTIFVWRWYLIEHKIPNSYLKLASLFWKIDQI